jgi:methyl coenzyme M reductase alpha subunit
MAASSSKRHFQQVTFAITLSAIAATSTGSASAAEAVCSDGQHRIMHANVVAFDQPMMINRLGTNRPQGMIYALLNDVCPD